jgi:serine/threonine-protein kinase RsbW
MPMQPWRAKPLSHECQMIESAADPVVELLVSPDASEVRQASAWLEKTGRECAVPEEQIGRLDLCLNEALANIIAHGGPDARSSPVRIVFRVHCREHGREAMLTVSDAGIPFNPLAFQPRSKPKTLSEAEPGGLGIMMMHEFSDSLGYRHSEGHNQTTFSVRWPEAE